MAETQAAIPATHGMEPVLSSPMIKARRPLHIGEQKESGADEPNNAEKGGNRMNQIIKVDEGRCISFGSCVRP